MKSLSLVALSAAFVGCAHAAKPAAYTSRLVPIQLYVFNRSGKTVDLKVALDDSVLYYAQVRTIGIPSEISGGRLVQRAPGIYHVTVNDFTHAQQVTREVPARDSGLYIVVTTLEGGSKVEVSTNRPF
jgi:hypothetical protein